MDERLFVSDIGEFNKRDGNVYVSPYVADVDRIWMVKDKATVFLLVGPKDFSAKFQISDTYGNAIFEVDLSSRSQAGSFL